MATSVVFVKLSRHSSAKAKRYRQAYLQTTTGGCAAAAVVVALLVLKVGSSYRSKTSDRPRRWDLWWSQQKGDAARKKTEAVVVSLLLRTGQAQRGWVVLGTFAGSFVTLVAAGLESIHFASSLSSLSSSGWKAPARHDGSTTTERQQKYNLAADID